MGIISLRERAYQTGANSQELEDRTDLLGEWELCILLALKLIKIELLHKRLIINKHKVSFYDIIHILNTHTRRYETDEKYN